MATKIFHVEVNDVQQNYGSHKKIVVKRRLMLTEYVQCYIDKEYVFTKNGSCCI